MGELIKQFLKHGLVGSIAFLVDFSIMVCMHENLGVGPLIASAFSFTVSVIVSYWGSMKWVFSRRDDMTRRREFGIYMVLSALGLVLNSVCMWIGERVLNFAGIDWTHGIYYMLVKVLATVVVTFYNFFSRRRWLDSHDPLSPDYDVRMW